MFEQFQESLQLLQDKVYGWLDRLVLSVPNLILVLLVFILGLIFMRIAVGSMKRLANRFFETQAVRNLFVNVGKITGYLILFIAILGILGLSKTVSTVLASAGVMGLALGLALQDPLMNFFSGVILSLRKTYKVGDFIETNSITGGVMETSLKSTVLRQLTGEEVSIPNKLVLQNPIKNFTTLGNRRIDIVCGISYGEDLRRVKTIASESVRALAVDNVERPVEFIYTTFGDSSINFQLRFWINTPNVWLFLDAKSEAIMRLKEAFDANDISIPFPIRTLDFGIKGGESLKAMIPEGNLA